jgi:hypothetical protein
MKIHFLHKCVDLEKYLTLAPEFSIIETTDLNKIMVFLIYNPKILEVILGKEEFEKQWQGPCPEQPVFISPFPPTFPPDRLDNHKDPSK